MPLIFLILSNQANPTDEKCAAKNPDHGTSDSKNDKEKSVSDSPLVKTPSRIKEGQKEITKLIQSMENKYAEHKEKQRLEKLPITNAKQNIERTDPDTYKKYTVPKVNRKKLKPKKDKHVRFTDDTKLNSSDDSEYILVSSSDSESDHVNSSDSSDTDRSNSTDRSDSDRPNLDKSE